MQAGVFWRLSVMMMFQYWIWGAWGPYLPVYLENELNFNSFQKSMIISMFYLAFLITPFVGGQFVDRYFSTEKFMAFAHIFAGIFILVMAESVDFMTMLIFMLLHSFLYAMTLPLTNSISFHNLKDVDREFGYIRVWGTLGWILAGWALTVWLSFDNSGENCLRLAGIISILLGLFSFILPHTPPNKEAKDPFAFLAAIKMLKKPSFLVFIIISFVVSTELMFYYFLTGPFLSESGISAKTLQFLEDLGIVGYIQSIMAAVGMVSSGEEIPPDSLIPAIMTIGQIAEIVTMVWILQKVLPKSGIKFSMMLGIIAWPLRYIIFAIGTPWWLVVLSLTLHGFCYVFFFVVGQIYVDKVAPKDIRGSAQSLIIIVTFGLGQLAGVYFAGWIEGIFTTGEGAEAVTNWTYVFIVPVVLTILCAIAFQLFFHEPKEVDKEELEEATP